MEADHSGMAVQHRFLRKSVWHDRLCKSRTFDLEKESNLKWQQYTSTALLRITFHSEAARLLMDTMKFIMKFD